MNSYPGENRSVAGDPGTLTEQELSAAHRALHDLGPGYPQLPLPGWCTDLAASGELLSDSLGFAPRWSPAKTRKIDADLDRSVRGVLGIHRDSVSVSPTFSGSVALDRAMTSVTRFARARGSARTRVITTTPCIDIMKLFLSERPDVVPVFVPSNRGGRFPYGLDEDGICDALDRACNDEPNSTHAVLLTSPENPTGETWPGESLARIASRCAAREAVLMVDHCFLLAGVQEARPAALWDELREDLEWVAVWDTGKTIGMNEEKLGFVIAGGSSLPRFVHDAVNTIQFGVSRRQKMIISRILEDTRFIELIDALRLTCRRNVEFLASVLADDPRLELRVPSAGTMAMIDCRGLQSDDEAIRSRLLAHDVGVISGRVFFHSDVVPTSLIRVALAREPSHFRTCATRLFEVLRSMR